MEKEKMTLDDYQQRAMSTCMPTSDNMAYMILGLGEEVGELMGKFAKAIRKGWINVNIEIAHDAPLVEIDNLYELATKELGDVLWMASGIARQLGEPLSFIAEKNIEKLAARKVNGTIEGNGDGVTVEERR